MKGSNHRPIQPLFAGTSLASPISVVTAGVAGLVAVLATLTLTLPLTACKRTTTPQGTLPYENDFSRPLGSEWYPSGGHWTLDDGALLTTGANNAPLFLQIDLPDDVIVEFDAMSKTDAVDTKFELMTDGRKHQSGYIFILGGWSNAKSIIARLDEHGAEGTAVVSKRPTGATKERWYHWRVEKRGGQLDWFLDGQPYLSFRDPEPLSGPGHNRFAFNNWQNTIRFDNLRISSASSASNASSASSASDSGAGSHGGPSASSRATGNQSAPSTETP